MTRPLSTVLIAACAYLVTAPVMAAVSYPAGTPIGNATSLFDMTAIYTTLPTPPAQPFAALPFSLTVNLPTAVSIANPSQIAPMSFFISGSISGSYTNDGQTEQFTNGNLQVNEFTASPGQYSQLPAGGPVTQLQVDAFDVLTNADELFIYPNLIGDLYSFSADGKTATVANGSYVVPSGTASYIADPPFAGVAVVTSSSTTPVPEPATLTLLAATLGLLRLRTPARRYP